MLIYILVILLILLMQSSLSGMEAGPNRDKTEIRYLKIVCWVLVILAALRGITVGTDTHGYWPDYLSMSNRSFLEVLSQYADYPGYHLLAKTCSLLHLPVQILFGIVEGVYVYAFYLFIKRYSSNKLYSILGFMTIGLYAFSLAGLKQVLSMAFILLGYMALDAKKYWQSVLLLVVAYFCHHVSLIFLAGVAIYFMRNTKYYYLYLVITVAVVLLGSQFLWGEMLSLLDNDHYSELYTSDEGYSSTSMIIYGVLLGILFIFSGRYRRLMPVESKIMLGMSTLAFALQEFSFISSAAFRLSFFFLPFMIVAFPNAFNCISNREIRWWVRIGVEVILIFIFVYTNRNGGSIVPYKFFWQQGLQ